MVNEVLPGRDVVRVQGVHKVFGGRGKEVVALSDATLSVAEGSFVTLFGPSGCGKSTLLRIMAGLLPADEGLVEVFGETPQQASRRKNIAWVPQSPALLPWRTIRSNIQLSAKVNRRADRNPDRRRISGDPDEILREVGLSKFAGNRPAELSGGMQQRAALARGFVHGAPLMLMDEPFSALDELTRDVLRLKLLDLWGRHRKTIVFVTHSAVEAVLLSDRVVVMSPRPGRIHRVVDIDLPRPRLPEVEESPEFAAKVSEVKSALRDGWSGVDDDDE
jgi:NitT/TauT family transport system ATP-binding protein